MINTYRHQASLEKYKAQKSGLMKAGSDNPWWVSLHFLAFDVERWIINVFKKKHKCNPPRKTKKFFLWLVGKSIPLESFYRCEDCKNIFCLLSYDDKQGYGPWRNVTNTTYGPSQWRFVGSKG
jgi:hypothetical protein